MPYVTEHRRHFQCGNANSGFATKALTQFIWGFQIIVQRIKISQGFACNCSFEASEKCKRGNVVTVHLKNGQGYGCRRDRSDPLKMVHAAATQAGEETLLDWAQTSFSTPCMYVMKGFLQFVEHVLNEESSREALLVLRSKLWPMDPFVYNSKSLLPAWSKLQQIYRLHRVVPHSAYENLAGK